MCVILAEPRQPLYLLHGLSQNSGVPVQKILEDPVSAMRAGAKKFIEKESLHTLPNTGAKLINALSPEFGRLMQQNYANQINVVQGYNTLNSTLQGIGAGIQSSISQLGYQLDSCCCALKTQMLQDKYDRLYEQYRSVQTDASNAAQSQYLLGVMGKWVANPASTTA